MPAGLGAGGAGVVNTDAAAAALPGATVLSGPTPAASGSVSGPATFAGATAPVVERTGTGGHVPYVRLDATPSASAAQPAGGAGLVSPVPVSDDQLRHELATTNELLRTLITLWGAALSP